MTHQARPSRRQWKAVMAETKQALTQDPKKDDAKEISLKKANLKVLLEGMKDWEDHGMIIMLGTGFGGSDFRAYRKAGKYNLVFTNCAGRKQRDCRKVVVENGTVDEVIQALPDAMWSKPSSIRV
jgi:hypothetical protein